MGDRTYVTILAAAENFKKLINEHFEGDQEKFLKFINAETEDFVDGEAVWSVEASEVNYTDWRELEPLLCKHRVDYDKFWEAGCEYEGGSEYVRFSPDGNESRLTTYDRDSALCEFIREAMPLVDDHETLRKRVIQMHHNLFGNPPVFPLLETLGKGEKQKW